MPTLHLAQHDEADQLLSGDPLALLIGMVLDQQIPLEHAFWSPYELQERLGRKLDARELADLDTDELIAIFAKPRALHRFPKAMAKRVQEMARVVADRYDNDPAAVWRDPEDGRDLLKRIGGLPGFGDQKARIFVALLGKQLGVQPPGWREAAGVYGEDGVFRSVADIVDEDSLLRVREYKKQLKTAAKDG